MALWSGNVQSEDTQHAEIAGKFALVAHTGQGLVGAGVLRHGGRIEQRYSKMDIIEA